MFNIDRLLDLIRIPFFLKLYAECIEPLTSLRLPHSEGELIKYFVEKSLKRKFETENIHVPFVPSSKFHSSLSVIAKELISLNVDCGQHYIEYPQDLQKLECKGISWDEILIVGEACGILQQSAFFSESSLDQGRIVFSHDLFRDYYGSLWLRQTGLKKPDKEHLKPLFEFMVWDKPFLLYFDTEKKINLLEQILYEIAKWDPYFAAECIDRKANWGSEIVKYVAGQLLQCEQCFYDGIKMYTTSFIVVDAAVKLLRNLPVDMLKVACNKESDITFLDVLAPCALIKVLGAEALKTIKPKTGKIYIRCPNPA